MDWEGKLKIAREHLRDRNSIDAGLSSLRQAGFNEIDCIKAMRTLFGMSLGEAKEIVERSDTWRDRRELHQSLRDEAIRELDE